MTQVFEPSEWLLPDGRQIRTRHSDGLTTLSLDDRTLMQFRLDDAGLEAVVTVVELTGGEVLPAVWAAAYWLFATRPDCQRLRWNGVEAASELVQRGLVIVDGEARVSLRGQFWQLPDPWLRAETSAGYPQAITMSNGVRFPRRAPKPTGEVYRRFDPRLGQWISLRTLDVEADLGRYNRWQNSRRVNEFWEEAGSVETHRAHLQALAADPHCLQLIGCFNDEPFGFFDAYWAREDRLGPYYDTDHYDRGIHMLVGEEHHRGPHKVASWLPALVHYLFLDEPRTRTIVSEPRADNDRMIGYLQKVGFHRQKDFDFPHKRAAMMALSRECFFDRCPVC